MEQPKAEIEIQTGSWNITGEEVKITKKIDSNGMEILGLSKLKKVEKKTINIRYLIRRKEYKRRKERD